MLEQWHILKSIVLIPKRMKILVHKLIKDKNKQMEDRSVYCVHPSRDQSYSQTLNRDTSYIRFFQLVQGHKSQSWG